MLRSQETTEGAKIELPYFEGINYTATLHYKRYQTQDDITDLDFQLDENKLFIGTIASSTSCWKN